MATATYEPIATTTLGSVAASITFSSIAATWTDLRIVFVGTSTSVNNNISIQFNSDSGTNYSDTWLYGDGASALSFRETDKTKPNIFAMGNSTSTPSTVNIDIMSYAGSTYKTCLIAGSSDMNGSGYTTRTVMLWRSTSAITTVSLLAYANNFQAGTTATLYGIKAA